MNVTTFEGDGEHEHKVRTFQRDVQQGTAVGHGEDQRIALQHAKSMCWTMSLQHLSDWLS